MASERGARTTFRLALQKALRASFVADGLDIEFQGGVIEGPQADRDIGCVWWTGKQPQGRDGNNEETFFQVRVLRRFKQDQGGSEPRESNAEELELTAEMLEDALVAVLVRPWLQEVVGDEFDLSESLEYFIVTEVTVNYPGHYVQATLQAWMRNRTARGG